MKRLFVANWKMNKTRAETREFLSRFYELAADFASNASVTVCPPFTALDCASAFLGAQSNVRFDLGAQNIHWEGNGAFTGDISGAMLLDFGVKSVIVGHSERYQYFGETPGNVSRRAAAALKIGVRPIICVGEKREDFEAGRSKDVVLHQLQESLEQIPEIADGSIVIAYEPVWAIGTGLAATPEIAEGMHRAIRTVLCERFGKTGGESVAILYGGSVTPENIASYIAQPNVNGALVGGASLVAEKFAALVQGGSN